MLFVKLFHSLNWMSPSCGIWCVRYSYAGGIFYLAAEAGNLGGLKAAASKYGTAWTSQFIAREVTRMAAEAGHLELLQWARGQVSQQCLP